MYKELSDLLRKPALYEKTGHRFWDDPHISKGMLSAHLNPETDAASRKPQTITKTVEWISEQLPPGAELLDLGCGPGLYTSQFAQCGFRVTGVDLSPRSLAYAREHDAATNYLEMDYLTMDFKAAFDAVTLIWCDYGALVSADRQILLQRVYRALKPGGYFLLDVFTPRQYDGFVETRSWRQVDTGGFWSPAPHLLLGLDTCYEGHIGLSRTVVVEEGAVRDYNIWDTTFTPETLAEEMVPFGFTPQVFYTDMTGNPLERESKTLCAVMRKQ